MKNYEVGQILFMTSPKSLNVLPVQIIEEVIRTTMNGQEKTYMLKMPDAKSTVIDIKDIKGELFSSKNELKDSMINNATKAIDDIIEKAQTICNKMFSNKAKEEKETLQESTEKNVQSNNKNDIISIDLGNGQKGVIKKENLNKVLS